MKGCGPRIESPLFFAEPLMIAGGLLVIIYLKTGVALKVIVAVNLGAPAPLLIGSFGAQTRPVELGSSN
jgi:hypothetical protein